MRTIKLVVIGSSNVGKTSLRSQYISGRFTTGYRATIGADFITKTLPHHSNPGECVTLQIWDTAGQERFSSLSSAFFRGADAALLIFDVNDPNTLLALNKWWAEFKDRAPLRDDEVAEFCCVVVGNKVDLAQADFVEAQAMEAMKLIDELVPPDNSPQESYSSEEPTPINIRRHRVSHSRSRSRSLLRGATASTLRSGFTSFHTTSSSIFDDFESARSSPVPLSRSPSPPKPMTLSSSPGSKHVTRKTSSSSTSSSAPTITPSLFARTHHPLPSISQQQALPAIITDTTTLDRRPKLFFTSAKTGEGVSDVFEYIAQRVTKRWEYNESVEARAMHMRDYTTDTIELRLHSEGRYNAKMCCS